MSATPPLVSALHPVPSPPRAVGRLQFHAGFTLDDAVPLVGYYAALGVSHLYASPILAARPGSTHGYDVIDCSRINPELGGEPALRRLVECLRAHGMGLVLDIVPNHMYAGAGNAWWLDVLRHGRASAYAGYFDIDWQSPDPLVRGRVLLPILGASYAESLRDGSIRLSMQADEFVLSVHDTALPLSPETQVQLRGADTQATLHEHDATDRAGEARLHALIERQHYRLVLWKLASDLVNYRRFFDINELAGLRVERTQVFEAAHALIFRLYAQGLIDGVRVDHVDGLADPHRYCRQLRHRLRRLQRERPPQAPRGPAYIVVEKILAEGELLRPEWQVDGTTGYDFMEQVAAVLHNAAGAPALDALWRTISGNDGDFAACARAAREQILVDSFAAERDRTSRALFAAARSELQTRDVSLAAIRRVLMQLLVWFPVYRTYAGGSGRDSIDEAVFQRAAAHAKQHVRSEDRALLVDMATWLGGQAPRELPPGRVRKARESALRVFQQATSPMAAKAVEDTACYRYGRLLSRNEVGADPGRLAITAEEFHAACAERARAFPHTLLATATHDHKRGEDARMRLAVLSDVAPVWASCISRWRSAHASLRAEVDGRPAPSPADEYMLYQSIVGAWPLELGPDDGVGLARFESRLEQWQRKALREAKHRSRWTLPNEPYEDACAAFLAALLAPASAPARELHAFVQGIAAAGAANSLAQTVLKLTTPGVPDIYQGTEWWDFSLVDPDNRRPVDFAARRQAVDGHLSIVELLGHWRDGRLKQQVIRRLLDLRERRPALFADGDYCALRVGAAEQDAAAGSLLAFQRGAGSSRIVVLVVCHAGSSLLDAAAPRVDAQWLAGVAGSNQPLAGVPPGNYRDVLMGTEAWVDCIVPAQWLQNLPVAVLECVDRPAQATAASSHRARVQR